MSTYKVTPFSGKNYHENAQGASDPCCICGKHVKAPKHWACVIDGGAAWGDETSESDPGHMGWYPVGPDCHRKHVVS